MLQPTPALPYGRFQQPINYYRLSPYYWLYDYPIRGNEFYNNYNRDDSLLVRQYLIPVNYEQM